jgi:hypothetical protein
MRKQLSLIVCLSLGLGLGCGKDDKKGEPAGKINAEKSASTKSAMKKVKAKSVIGGTASVDVKKLITSEIATPFGELAKIKFGMTKEEAAKINPALVEFSGLEHGGVTYRARTGRKTSGDKNQVRVNTLWISFYADFKYVPWIDVKAQLDAQWGKPIDHADFNLRDATSHFWFNPKAGIRAMLNGFDEKRAKVGFAAKLKFQAYMPLDKWLGEPGKPFPFLVNGKDLIGMAAADVKKNYAYTPKKRSASALPYVLRTEWDGDHPPSVMVYVDDEGNVNRYSISLKYKHHPKGAAAVLAAINAKFPGKEIADNTWAEVGENTWAKHEPGMKSYRIHVGKKP